MKHIIYIFNIPNIDDIILSTSPSDEIPAVFIPFDNLQKLKAATLIFQEDFSSALHNSLASKIFRAFSR